MKVKHAIRIFLFFTTLLPGMACFSFPSFALYNNGEDGGSYDNRTATPLYGADTELQSFSGTNYIGYYNTQVPTSNLESSTFSGTNNIHGGSNMDTTVYNSEFKGSGGATIAYTDWNDSVTVLDSNEFNQATTINADATGQSADATLDIVDNEFNRNVTLNASGANASASSGYVSLEGNTFNSGFTLNSDNVTMNIGSTQETQTIISVLQSIDTTTNYIYDDLFTNNNNGFQGLFTRISNATTTLNTTLTTINSTISTMSNNITQLLTTTNSTLSTISGTLTSNFNTFWTKYNPDGSGWQYYDTSTKQAANSGLKGVFYKLTEYTGKVYEYLTREDQNLEDSADSLDNTLSSLESSEAVVTQGLSTDLASFNPNLGQVSNLAAITWVSNLLQSIFLALGSFQIPIMVSLFLGVGMQFVGYFRYK